MKVSREILILIAIALGTGSSCARVERVKAMEGEKPVPYESLGILEVKEKARLLTPEGTFWTGVEIATLSFAKTPTRGTHYKKYLRRKLARIADRKYQADAVINVQYWPDPEAGGFPDGFIYARGEMIRYESFPSEAPQQPTSQMPA